MVAVSRPQLVRAILGSAVVVCVVSAVLTLTALAIPGAFARLPAGSAIGMGTAAPAVLEAAPPIRERAVVVRVVDAVTLDTRLPDGGPVIRVRALGVQAPGECYAEESTAFAQRVLAGRAVDLVSEAGPTQDRFDRRLAQVVLGSSDYAVLAAEAGVARAYSAGAPATSMAPVHDAQARARDAGRGLWGPPCLGAETPAPSGP